MISPPIKPKTLIHFPEKFKIIHGIKIKGIIKKAVKIEASETYFQIKKTLKKIIAAIRKIKGFKLIKKPTLEATPFPPLKL